MIRLEQLEHTPRPAFEELLRETWDQTWDDKLAQRIVQWRYYDRPTNAKTWVVIDDNNRCLALLDSMLRPYLLDGKPILVRETADWYCTPAGRPHGLGLWLLRQLTKHPEPVIVLGGSALTVEILTKLNWANLPPASSYVLPVRARGLLGNMIRQKWPERESLARTVPRFVPARSPRTITAPTGRRCEIRTLTPDDLVVMPPPKQSGLVELLDTAHWQWLVRMPLSLAEPIGLMFLLDDEPVGLTVSQIETTASGHDAKIVHLQIIDPNATAWMISATARLLASHGVGFIRCYVSTPEKIAALESVGFIKSKEVPCYWLSREARIVPSMADVGYLRGDDALPFQSLRGRPHAR